MRIGESALNDFAAALQPLTTSRNFKFTLWIPNPFLFGIPTPVDYSCTVTVSVAGLVFDVTPAATTVRGSVSGTLCGIGYQSSLFTTVAVSLGSGGRSLDFVPGPMRVTPTVNFLGFRVTGPPIDVGSALAPASVPLDANFEIDTPAGSRRLSLAPQNLQLSRHDGYLEIKGDARLR
jgi:hypothetical protein